MTAHLFHPFRGGPPLRLPAAARVVLIAGVLLGGLSSLSLLVGQLQSPATTANQGDRHYGTAIDHQLWLDPWAHGYQHGYEDGFHQGEWAHQMFEHPRPVKKQADWKHADRGYQPVMGDHKQFQEGYRKGFEDGYLDAYTGRPFEALAGLQQHDPGFVCQSGCQPSLVASRPNAPH